ncbi:MAG: DUF1460 domain-containing protein, partial [Rickettsiales bacterium]|nr:DUF1460 domain-containing protein [Rickettsiales bacterium]
MRAPAAFLLMVLAAFPGRAVADISASSARFLGARYLLDPLGEGSGRDADPLVRFDAFDCLTFIETVLALELGRELSSIRYKGGRVGFASRNHFLSADWLANNADIVRDITRDLGVPFAYRNTVIDRRNWFLRTHRLIVQAAPARVDSFYIVKMDLSAYREKLIASITVPLLAAFVQADEGLEEKIGTDLVYSHIGFLIPGGESLVLRHASSSAGRVVDM